MSLFDNIKKNTESFYEKIEEKAISYQDIGTDIASYYGVSSFPKKKTEDYLQSARGWVYGAVDAIANDVAMIDLHHFKMSNGEPKEVEKSEVLQILFRANSQTTKFDLFYLTQTYLELSGEAPWYLSMFNGRIQDIILLRPDRLEVIPSKEEGKIIDGYKYKVYSEGKYEEITLAPEEVIFLKYPDTTKTFRGKGTLEAAARTVDIDESSEIYNYNFFQNSATPSASLETDKKLSKEVIRKLKNEIEKKYSGKGNSHKTLVLEGGLKWKNMSISQKDMDFIEGNKFNRDKILGIFKVPKSVLGLTEDVNRANAEASDYVFAKRTIKPKMQKLVEMLNEFLVPLFDDSGESYLDFTDPVPEDLDKKVTMAEKGVAGGFLTINEARSLLGFEELPEGDVLKEPGAINVQPPEKKKTNKQFVLSNLKRSYPIRKAKAVKKALAEAISEEASKIIESQMISKAEHDKQYADKNKLKKKTKGVINSLGKQKKLEFHTEFNRLGVNFEQPAQNAFNKYLRGAQSRVLKKLNKKAEERPDINLDPELETVQLGKAMTPVVGSVILEQSRSAFRLLRIEDQLSPRNKIVREFIEDRMQKIGLATTEETNKVLGKILADGFDNGESIAKISRSIKDKFNDWKGSRAERVARTEISKAGNWATERAYIESGVVDAKEWYATLDERTGDLDASLHGTVVNLGKNFIDKGEERAGVKFDFEDIGAPPLHPNCRCVLLPVIN